MDEDEFSLECREAVVDDDVHPLAVLPDAEVEDTGVVLDEQVVVGNDVGEQVRVSGGAQRRSRSQEPAVTSQQKQVLFAPARRGDSFTNGNGVIIIPPSS